MVRPLYKWAVKGEINSTGTSKKRTKEKLMLRNLKFNFPYYSCKRIAKPYPNGPVYQRDSFRDFSYSVHVCYKSKDGRIKKNMSSTSEFTDMINLEQHFAPQQLDTGETCK